jgi:lauroyl/myristoyl acyltransferase
MNAEVTHAVEQPAGGSVDARPHVERVRRLLEGPADPAEVREAMLALTEGELIGFGLNAFRLNLMSLFGETWSAATIACSARDAAISKMWLGWEYHHHYLPRLTATPEPPRLESCPVEKVASLLALRRGLVIVLFHHGHMRDIPSDLAHAGITVTIPLATDSFNDYESARLRNPDAALWAGLKYVNVEESRGSLSLARRLAKGEAVVSTIDGNTGMDGPRGDDRRATVRLLGCTARVKDGLIRMAARFGAPVLPMVAHTVDGRPTCTTSPVMDPGGPLSGDGADAFVQDTLQESYACLGRELVAFPGQWSGGDLFHRWRIPDPAPRGDVAEAERGLSRDLESGGSATINGARIVALPGDDGILWTDAKTMRCYRLPADMAGFADRLSSDAGVDQAWLERQGDASRSRIWTLMCQLAARDAIRSSTGGTPPRH